MVTNTAGQHYIGSLPHGISIQSGLAFCECMSLKYRSDRGKKRIKASHQQYSDNNKYVHNSIIVLPQ